MRAVINRYQGNSGRFTRYSDAEDRAPKPLSQRPGSVQMSAPPKRAQSPLGALDSLGRLLPEKLGELENEDFILLLILYLMYRESGDSDLLIIMGAMFLL